MFFGYPCRILLFYRFFKFLIGGTKMIEIHIVNSPQNSGLKDKGNVAVNINIPAVGIQIKIVDNFGKSLSFVPQAHQKARWGYRGIIC